MKIGFFLNNEELEGLNWEIVSIANPGAGGTEYVIVLESYMMSLEKDVEFVLYAVKSSIFPKSITVKYVSTLKDAIIDANKNGIDFFVFKENQKDPSYKHLTGIPNNTSLIVWCHNFLSKKSLDVYANCKSVKSIICVGREMLDLYRDEKAFSKMDYIYNGCVFEEFERLSNELTDVKNRENIVTYIGSIIPSKSFHWLAKAWPNVIERVPDAQLYVIGTGNLYNKNAKLGKYGIASENYERKFLKFLTDDNGNILPSVHFLGKMGEEKNDIIKMTKVGVPNPSGKTETFGITAVEMQSLGCHVVTRKCYGYLDTVVNQKNLYKHPCQLSSYIINGLLRPDTNFEKVHRTLEEKFDFRIVHNEWMALFHNLCRGKNKIHNLDTDVPNMTFNHKWFRLLFSIVNQKLGYVLPTEQFLSELWIFRKIAYYLDKVCYLLVK